MSKKNAIVLKDRVYIPLKLVNPKEVKEAYTTKLYEDKNCLKCEYMPDRHSYLCDTCENYKGTTKLFKLTTKNDINYIGLPIGDKANIEKKTGIDFSELKIRDKRVRSPFTVKFKQLIEPRDYQAVVIKQFMKKKYGLIKAPPRTGKTFMMLHIAIQLGHRAVLLANQHEYLTQFLDHIHGNDEEGIPKCTNLAYVAKKQGKKLYGFPKTDEDFANFQFFVMTYQQFMSEKKGKDRFKRIAREVGTLMIDEVDKANSPQFAEVIGKFPSLYKFGVTGTVERKDKRHFIVRNILGPVVAESTREALTPTVILHKTEFKPKAKYAGKAGWVRANQAIANDKKRNAQIVEYIMKDLKNGHNIVIPVVFKKHAAELQHLINKAYQETFNTNKKICELFVGGGTEKGKRERKDILSRAKANKTRCIVGIRSILQRGLNVPTWSAIYEIAPISNEPNLRQETKRVCTPMEGKRDPIIRLFVDMELGQSIGCARNTIKHMKGFKYKFMKSDKQHALQYEILGDAHRKELESEWGGGGSDDSAFIPTKSLFDKVDAKKKPERPKVKRL